MADETFNENPWSREFWNLTKQGAYIRKYGLEVAKTKAKQAGTRIGLPAPSAIVVDDRKVVVIIQRRDTSGSSGGGGGGGGGLVGAGSSGDGPPA